jgi:hypothetical protein
MDLRALLKQALVAVLLVNLLVGVLLYLAVEQAPMTNFLLITQRGKFEDSPAIPYRESKAWRDYLRNGEFSGSHQGLLNDPNYCEDVKEYRETKPLTVGSNGLPPKKEIVVFSDYKPGNLVKDVIDNIGVLALKDHYLDKSTSVSAI